MDDNLYLFDLDLLNKPQMEYQISDTRTNIVIDWRDEFMIHNSGLTAVRQASSSCQKTTDKEFDLPSQKLCRHQYQATDVNVFVCFAVT